MKRVLREGMRFVDNRTPAEDGHIDEEGGGSKPAGMDTRSDVGTGRPQRKFPYLQAWILVRARARRPECRLSISTGMESCQ